MSMPTGCPLKLQCTSCGKIYFDPGLSDCIVLPTCTCGSQKFESEPIRLPRALWPLASKIIYSIRFRK